MKQKNKIKICMFCQTKIDIRKEYLELIHHKKEKLINFFHTNCFKEQITKNQKIANQADELYAKAKRILNVAERIGGIEE